jgi:hypothetical protein
MVLTGILGTAMGLNNTAAFMSSCVAFVAVSMWMDSRLTRRRREEAAREAAARDAAGQTEQRPEADFAVDADSRKPDGHGS